MAVFLRATSSTSGDATWVNTSTLEFAPANTLIVAESGGQYTTIESAIAAAAAGDTVLVYPGSYTVPVAGYTVPADVTLQGVSRDECILNASTNSPAAAVTLGLASVVSDFEILMADGAGDVGVLMSGTSSVAKNLRIGTTATAANAPVGISVSATACEIRDITYFTALGQGLVVTAAGLVHAFNLNTAGTVTGTAATYFIDAAGTLYLIGARLRITTGEGVRANAATAVVECHAVNITINFEGFRCEAAGELTLVGCRTSGRLSGSAAANVIRSVYGNSDYYNGVNIPQAAGDSILPMVSGEEIVPTGTSSVTFTCPYGAGYNNRPAYAVLIDAEPGIAVSSCTWAAGDLTITLTGNTTGDRRVAWTVIDGG